MPAQRARWASAQPPAAYTASATDYNGTTQYSERAGGLNGIADSKQAIFSAWFKPTFHGVTSCQIFDLEFHSGDLEVDLVEYSPNVFALNIGAFNGTVNQTFYTSPNYAAVGAVLLSAWNHLLFSFDAQALTGKIYLNDADVTPALVINNIAMPYTNGVPGQKIVGIATSFGIPSGFKGCASEVFFDTSYLDLSVAANRRKFISAARKPVSLGADGSLPLGHAPLLYVPDGLTANKGTGGNLTNFGASPACASAP